MTSTGKRTRDRVLDFNRIWRVSNTRKHVPNQGTLGKATIHYVISVSPWTPILSFRFQIRRLSTIFLL